MAPSRLRETLPLQNKAKLSAPDKVQKDSFSVLKVSTLWCCAAAMPMPPLRCWGWHLFVPAAQAVTSPILEVSYQQPSLPYCPQNWLYFYSLIFSAYQMTVQLAGKSLSIQTCKCERSWRVGSPSYLIDSLYLGLANSHCSSSFALVPAVTEALGQSKGVLHASCTTAQRGTTSPCPLHRTYCVSQSLCFCLPFASSVWPVFFASWDLSTSLPGLLALRRHSSRVRAAPLPTVSCTRGSTLHKYALICS